MTQKRPQSAAPRVVAALLLLYVLTFDMVAVGLQLRASEPPWTPSSPIDFFSASLLWLLSLLALKLALLRSRDALRLLFWLGCSAGLALVAIDEMMEYHERTRFAVGDDDYIKVATWGAAAAGLLLLHRVERLPRLCVWVLAVGYGFHTLWLVTDLGDGDLFTLPLALDTLRWTEELCELFALSCYFAAFFLLHDALARAVERPT